MEIKNLLVPTDGSDLSLLALEHAEKLAQALGAKILLFRVAAVLSPEAFGIPELSMALTTELSMHQAKIEATLASHLEELAKPLRDRGLEVECLVRTGDAATQIVEIAESQDVDVVVMSSHGRTGLKRWIYGSVTERVLHNVRCSLMVVRVEAQHLKHD